MRKAHRLTPEDLLPYQWQMPRTRRPRHGEKSEESRENKPEGDSRALLNWSELFGNSNPVEIEVGMGKGLFLLTSSASPPTPIFSASKWRESISFTPPPALRTDS